MTDTAPLLCAACAAGDHTGHRPWTVGPARGSDAGCATSIIAGRECRCSIRIPRNAR